MRIRRTMILETGLAVLALVGMPGMLRAASWPKKAFEWAAAKDALVSLYGTDTTSPSDRIELSAPLVAENGAIVPISIQTTLEGVRSISIVVEKNPRPLAATFEFLEGTIPAIDCRIKMAESSPVMVVVQTPAGLFSSVKKVTVTVGGCGQAHSG